MAYLEAWFAVDQDGPVILEIPKIEGRYYTAQICDRQFKSEVQHLEVFYWGTHRDSLMFTTTKGHPYKLHPIYNCYLCWHGGNSQGIDYADGVTRRKQEASQGTTVAACRFHASVHSFNSAMLQPFEQLGKPFTVARREARRQLG